MGLFDILGFSKKEGKDAGNPFVTNEEDRARAAQATQDLLKYQGSNAALDPLESSRIATDEVANNDILGGLFGQGGTMGRTIGEEQNLASRGYSLQPEDYEAYGQGSGNIAREFDASEGGLAQALANRGLSNSGVANQAFVTSQGNKLEQLAGLQRKIADDRMKSNLARLSQTRSFLSQLGQQGQNAIQDQYGRQAGSERDRFNQQVSKANAGQNLLSAQAGQGNINLQQQMATESSGIGGALGRGLSGAVEAAPGAALSSVLGRPKAPAKVI
jgi:hypothetical protein